MSTVCGLATPGKNGESCVTVGPVTRTAGILVCSRLKALAANGAGDTGHLADVGKYASLIRVNPPG